MQNTKAKYGARKHGAPKHRARQLELLIKRSIIDSLCQGIKGDLERYGRITAITSVISFAGLVVILAVYFITLHSPHNILWAVTSPYAGWIKWFWPALAFCFGLLFISWSYLKLATYSLDKNETRLKFSWTIVFLFLFLFGSILLMSSLYHFGLWEYLNRTLVDTVIILSAKWRTDMTAFLAQCKEELNVIPFVTSFLGTGLLVLSLSNDRHRSNLNPYTLQEYFPVLPFLCALLFFLMALIYFMTVRLFALLLIATVIHVSICVAIPVFFHVLHTPQHIVYQMADMLIKKVRSLKRHESSQDSSKAYFERWPENPDFLSIMEDMTLWKRQLMQNAQGKTLGDSLYAQVKYHAMALKKACEKISFVLSNEGEQARSYFSFAMGLWIGTPAYGAEDELQRSYFRFMLKELKQNGGSGAAYTNELMCGMLAARLLEGHRPLLGKEGEGVRQNAGAGGANDCEKQCAQSIRLCVEDCEFSLGESWRSILKLQKDRISLLKMWIYHVIVARLPDRALDLELFKCIEVSEVKEPDTPLLDESHFNLTNSLWKLYLKSNYIDAREMDYSKAKNAFVKVCENAREKQESSPTNATVLDLNSKEYDNASFEGKITKTPRKQRGNPGRRTGKGRK